MLYVPPVVSTLDLISILNINTMIHFLRTDTFETLEMVGA